MLRRDLFKEDKKNIIHSVRKPKGYRSEKYVDELTQEEKDQFLEYDKVGLDPGVNNLLFATNGKNEVVEKENGKPKRIMTTFKYSQDQRRKETKSKKYMKIIDKDKKETLIDEITVKKHEESLSKFNSKSCKYDNTVNYIKEKNKVNDILFSYYEKELYRKLKWYGFINRQKTESWMINKFKDIFGEPDKVVIGFGDYDQKHIKYKEPTKGKGFRKIFRQAGYNTFLVDEYKTSCTSFITELPNENFRQRGNSKPYKNNIMFQHGLLRSKNIPNNNSNAKHILYDRDYNGSMNIRKIFVNHLENKPISDVFKRPSVKK